MKSKFILAASLLVATTFSSFAFSGHNSGDKKPIPAAVMNGFKNDFARAGGVTWVANADYYKACFIQSGVVTFAFYAADGDLIGMGRMLSNDTIPVSFAKQIAVAYPDYKLTELYEIGMDKSGGYLLVLNNGTEQIKLRSVDNVLTEVKK